MILRRNLYVIPMAAYDVHMPKVMLPATRDSTQELVYNTNGSIRCSYAKYDAASDTNQLFKIQSIYKFPSLPRNQLVILWRLPDLVCQKMMLPVTRSSCLKYIHTNISLYVGTGTRYIDTIIDLYPKTSAASDKTYCCQQHFFCPDQTIHLWVGPLVSL